MAVGSPVGPRGLAPCTAAPSDSPFPSSAALPTKRPPAPTRSTATESASGLAAKPSVRTWDSLSSKCSPFWGRFSRRRGEPTLWGRDSVGLAEGETLEMGLDVPKSVCPVKGGQLVLKEKTPEIAARGKETQCSGQERAGAGSRRGEFAAPLLGGERRGGSRWRRGSPLTPLVGSSAD